MKKRVTALRLHRETIRSLSGQTLGKVEGGFVEDLDTVRDHTCGTVCDIPSWHCTYCSIC